MEKRGWASFYRIIRSADGAEIYSAGTVFVYATDKMGRAGLVSDVDNRNWEHYELALGTSLIGGLAGLGKAKVKGDEYEKFWNRFFDNTTEITTKVLEQYMSIAPLITIVQGEPILIRLTADISLKHPAGGRKSYLQKKRKARNRLISAVAPSVIVLAAYKCLGETAPSSVVEERFSVSVKEDTTLELDALTAASFVGLEDDRCFKAYDMTQIELTGKITGTDKEAYTVEWTELRHIENDQSAGLTIPMTTTEKSEKDNVIKDGTVLPVSEVKDQLTSVLPLLFFVPS